jgi:hypothetical protein
MELKTKIVYSTVYYSGCDLLPRLSAETDQVTDDARDMIWTECGFKVQGIVSSNVYTFVYRLKEL